MLSDKQTIFLAAALIYLLSGPMVKSASAQAPKNKQDVFGLTIGMAESDANKLITERGWKCQTFFQVTQELYVKYSCDTAGGSLFIRFGSFLENKPLISATLSLTTGDTSANIVTSISEQYGRRAKKLSKRTDSYDVFQWSLRRQQVIGLHYFQ